MSRRGMSRRLDLHSRPGRRKASEGVPVHHHRVPRACGARCGTKLESFRWQGHVVRRVLGEDPLLGGRRPASSLPYLGDDFTWESSDLEECRHGTHAWDAAGAMLSSGEDQLLVLDELTEVAN